MRTPTETAEQAARRVAKGVLDKGYDLQAVHSYTDQAGDPLYYRVRAKHPQTGEKFIRPFHWSDAGYVQGEPKFERGKKPLYRLHELHARTDETVIVTEGELKADRLAALGLLATTSGGAQSAEGCDWSILAGRRVVIWPDKDQAGAGYAAAVAAILRELGRDLSIVDAAVLEIPEGGDAVDWLAAHPGATADDVLKLPLVTNPAVTRPPSFVDAPRVELIDGGSVVPERINWLWKGYLARGKLHIVAGAPGTGKTTLALAMAATVSRGGRWPDGAIAECGTVVIWSGEDAVADTLCPRLKAAGADMRRVRFVDRTVAGSSEQAFDLATDMPLLARAIEEEGDVRLVILDPIVSAVAGDSHKNTEVRRALQPIVDAAGKHRAAVLGITHFTKGTAGRDVVERVTGSIAYGAVARVVFATAKRSDEEGGGRIFVRAKSNIGPDGGGFGYDLAQYPVPDQEGLNAAIIEWKDALDGSALALLAEAEIVEGPEASELGYVTEWLGELLDGKAVPTKEVKEAARAAGFAWGTVRRAQVALKVKPRKAAMDAGWTWGLPRKVLNATDECAPSKMLKPADECAPSKMLESNEDAHTKGLSTFDKVEHLRADFTPLPDDEEEAF